jgi:hypothetical protein
LDHNICSMTRNDAAVLADLMSNAVFRH